MNVTFFAFVRRDICLFVCINQSIKRDLYLPYSSQFSGPEVLFKTCVAMKFVDDDDDDDDDEFNGSVYL